MIKISIGKDIFENILSGDEKVLKKESTKFWMKNLLEPKLIDDKLYYELKKISKIKLTNGLGDEKPSIVAELKEIVHNKQENIFEFHIRKITEHKNVDMKSHQEKLIEKLQKEKYELEQQVFTDHLTKAFNRVKMEIDLNRIIDSKANDLSLIFVDADHFKMVNDKYGHDAGDKALKYIVNKMKKYASLLQGEVYRYGGEEFVMSSLQKKDLVLQILKLLKSDIKSEQIEYENSKFLLTVSMGVSFWNQTDNLDNIIKKADLALYKAKNSGRDRIVIYDE